jgi:MIP family channel proteins
MQSGSLRMYTAELIGTFCLVFAGAGAVVVNDLSNEALGHVGVSLTFGLIVTAMIYAVGDVSDAHLNPATTIGFYLAKRIRFKEALLYCASQFCGGVLGSLLLLAIFPEHSNFGMTLPKFGVASAFLFETILTFILMFVIVNVATGAKEKGTVAGIAIGATVALDALFGGPLSRASMNPARSLGPAVASLTFDYLWLYMVAPLLGAALAIGAWRMVGGATGPVTTECC